MKPRCLFLSLAAIALLSPSPACAHAVREQPEARFLLEAMRAQRMLLESGLFRIKTGTCFEDVPSQPNSTIETPFSVFCAFDKDRVRFDRTELTNAGFLQEVDDEGHPVIPPGHEPRRELTMKYFKTLERSAHWTVGQPLITYSKPSKTPATHPFDVRALGIYTDGDFQNALGIRELIDTILESNQNATVETEKDGSKVLTLSNGENTPDAGTRYRIWINVAKGFTPFKGDVAARVHGDWQEILKHETKWDNQKDVWLPVSYSIDARTILGESHSVQRFDVLWEAVNSKIDDSLFTYESFGAREPFGLVDDSTGELVMIKPVPKPTVSIEVPPRINSVRVILIAANLLLVVGLGIALLARILRRHGDRLSPG